MSGFVPLNAGPTVSVRRKRLNVFVLLTPALAGESSNCISRERIHTRPKYHTQLAKLSFDQFLVDLKAKVYFFFLF